MSEGSQEAQHAIGEVDLSPRPLSPERYRNYITQRKIIGFLQTSESSVLKMHEYPISPAQREAFDDEIMEGKYDETVLKDMLLNISLPFDSDDGMNKYWRFVSYIKESEEIERRIGDFLGRDIGESFAPIDISLFLVNHPTPIDVMDEVDDYLAEKEDELGEDERINQEEVLRIFLEGIYGERMSYWQNFRLLADGAFNKNTPDKISSQAVSHKMRNRITGLSALGIGALTAYGGLSIGADLRDGKFDGPAFLPPVIDTVRTETSMENEVKDKFGIEILDIREGFKHLGQNFNLYDEGELGNHPPTRWSEDQILLLSELLPRLPSKFYKPNDETKLNFSLTDYGKDCPCAGTFHDKDILFLSDRDFNRNNGNWPFELLTHELTHRMDIDVLQEKMWPKVNEVLGFSSFKDAREHYMPVLDDVFSRDQALEGIYYKLNYGFNGLSNEGLDDPTELIAVMAEAYVGGRKNFMQTRAFLGKEKARELYDLMKNEMFDGMEYDQNELPLPQNISSPTDNSS